MTIDKIVAEFKVAEGLLDEEEQRDEKVIR